jgi:sec-independent protein translocase protein TatA
MPGWFGLPEMIVLLFVVLIVFGAGKLPQVAEQLGTGIRNFKKSLRGDDDETNKQLEDKS